MLQWFIFKVKLYFVTAVLSSLILQLNQVEEYFHRAFWNWFRLMGFGELNLILENVSVLLDEKYLIDVNFRPLIDDSFNNIQAFFFSHFK